jgi:hypothetical protein
MGPSDFILSAVILGGAGYLLYRSIWKKKGHCAGCPGGGCGARERGPVVLARPRGRPSSPGP